MSTCCNVQLQRLSVQMCYYSLLLSLIIIIIIGINVYELASGADVAERIFAKGT